MAENMILALLRLTGSFLMYVGICHHIETVGLSNPQKESTGKIITAGWFLWTLYLLLWFADFILSFG